MSESTAAIPAEEPSPINTSKGIVQEAQEPNRSSNLNVNDVNKMPEPQTSSFNLFGLPTA